MKFIRNSFFCLTIFLTGSLMSCFTEDIIQPIAVRSLALNAGGIIDGERSSYVSRSSPAFPVSLSNFGLEIDIDDWSEVGADVDRANTFVSENAIADILITSDSIIRISEDSVYTPGEDLSSLFMTDRAGRSFFDPRFPVSNLIGRNLSFDPMILQLVTVLESDLHQTFLIDLTMDDGQTFELQSNMVLVEVE